jgi:hypothetical protein
MVQRIKLISRGLDLYSISRDLLKSIIIETATKSPHPWIIDPKRKDEITEVNRTNLKRHLNELNGINIERNERLVSPVIYETVYHAFSLLLGQVFPVLGINEIFPLRIISDLFEFEMDGAKKDENTHLLNGGKVKAKGSTILKPQQRELLADINRAMDKNSIEKMNIVTIGSSIKWVDKLFVDNIVHSSRMTGQRIPQQTIVCLNTISEFALRVTDPITVSQ